MVWIYMAWGMANMDEPAAQLFMPAMMYCRTPDLALNSMRLDRLINEA